MLAVALGGCLLWSELVALLTLSQAHRSYADSRYLRGFKKRLRCATTQCHNTIQGKGIGVPQLAGRAKQVKHGLLHKGIFFVEKSKHLKMALQTFVVVEKSKHLKMALSIFFVEKSKHLKLRSDSDALSIVLSRLTTALSCLPACRSANNAGSRPGMRHARSACIVARCTWSISAGLWGNTPTGQPCACVESHDRRQAYPTCPESTGACAVASAAKCTIENRSSCTCYSSSVRTTDSTSARLRTPSCGRPIHGVRADAIPWPSVRPAQRLRIPWYVHDDEDALGDGDALGDEGRAQARFDETLCQRCQ